MKAEEHRDRAIQAVPPQAVSIASAKDLDGSLVTVHGTLTQALVDDAPYGDRLWLSDETGTVQIYVPRSTGIHPAQLPWLKPGQSLQVTGLSSEYDGNDEVIPRDRSDLVNRRPRYFS
jgi:DNA/RNA endonuclease YhcR with UshA esterase domain